MTLDAELDQLVQKYGIKAVKAAAARVEPPAPVEPAKPKRRRKPAEPKPKVVKPEPEYDPKTGMRLPLSKRKRTYTSPRLPKRGVPVVAQPSLGTIGKYMGGQEGKKTDQDRIAEMLSEDIEINNGMITEDCGKCHPPEKKKKKKKEQVDEHCGVCPEDLAKKKKEREKKKQEKEDIVKEEEFEDETETVASDPMAEPGDTDEGPEGVDLEAIATMDHWVDRLGGGFADGRHPSEFDTEQLIKGINVELEHTDCPYTACEIAMDHLAEIEDYYTRLAEMEAEAKRGEEEVPGEPEPEEEPEEEKPEPPFGEDIDRIADTIIG